MGNWIWTQESQGTRNFYLYARKLFELPAKPDRAIIKTSAGSRYKLYVNGRYVGKGPVRSMAGLSYYDTYDITELLGKGKNVIAFLVHHFGEKTYIGEPRKPGLICKAEIETGDQRQVIVTDETWKVRRAPDWTDTGARINESLGFQEVYDSSARLDGWNEVKFKEKDWENAVIVGVPPASPWGRLIERKVPQLAEEKLLPVSIVGVYNSPDRDKDVSPQEVPEVMAASELVDLSKGSIKHPEALLTDTGNTQIKTPRGDRGVAIILDFGREVFGNLEISIGGSGSGTIDIGYGEILEDNRVKPNRGEMKYADCVILKKGKLNWQSFEPRSFRYLQIEFRRCSKAVSLEHISVNQTTYPVELTGSFECSDPILNDIWRIGAYTASLCMEDTFIDSPWRDRAQWWADARIESRTAYYAFDDVRLMAQGLRQIAETQDRNGAIMGVYPATEDKLIPDFALYWVFSILDYYAFSDDAGLVRDLYPNVKRLMGWFARYKTDLGLLGEVPGWVFIDSTELERRGTLTSLNCLYYEALKVTAMLASVQGKDNEAEDYIESARKLRLAINKYLYSTDCGLYADSITDGKLTDKFSSQTNILAALFDIPDHYSKGAIVRLILNGTLSDVATPFFTSHWLEALYSSDRHKEALDVIRKKWGPMVEAGDETFSEFFDQEGSRCHGWSTGPTRDLLAEYVGIKPVLGLHRFSVTPHEGDLKWARGTITTKTGLVTVEWKSTPRAFTIDVQVPDGLKVDIYPPCPANTKLTVNGKVHPSCLVTLSAGKHALKVTSVRPVKYRPLEKLPQPAPIPMVELLDDLSVQARRSLGLITSRRGEKGRSGKRGKAAREKVEEVTLFPELEGVVEEEIITEIAAQKSEAAAEPEVKHKKRSRRGRGRSKSKVEETAVAQVPAEQGSAEISLEPVIEEPVAEPGAGAAVQEEPKKSSRRRSHRGGRKRSSKTAKEEQSVQTPSEQEPVPKAISEPVEPVHVVEEEAKPTKKRTHRGGRRRSVSKKEAVTSEEPAPAIEESAIVEPAAEAGIEEQPKKKRRTYTRRPRKKAVDESKQADTP
jgi:alpha-L-rhamnosidase